MRKVAFILTFALWLTASLAFAAAPPVDYSITTDVIASGGQTSASTSYSVMSTVGQPAVGMGDGSTYNACNGYWCGITFLNARLYVPVIRRD